MADYQFISSANEKKQSGEQEFIFIRNIIYESFSIREQFNKLWFIFTARKEYCILQTILSIYRLGYDLFIF